MKHFLGGLLLAVSTLIPSSSAIGLIVIQEDASTVLPQPDPRPDIPRHWLPRPIHRYTPLEIKAVSIEAKIKDQVARTKIEEEFYNPNPRQLEGTFILPLPKGAHLDKFAMEINGQMAEAELLSAEKAKGIYEEIVRKARDPALLEYLGRDLIKVRIFPIEPHSTKKVEITYDQLLKNDSGLTQFILPLNTAQYSATPIKTLSLKVNLESSSPLKTIYSPSHSVEVLRHTSTTAVVGFEDNQSKPEKDFELFYSAQQKELGVSLLTHRKAGEDGYFMLLASPAFDTTHDNVLPKDVVFVLDTSGSMSGKKLAQAKKALAFCVNNLNREDRFEVIRFSTETESLFNSLTPYSDRSRETAEKFIEDLKPTGGTAINDALKKALEIRPEKAIRPYLVVFLTDGLPTTGDRTEEGILKTATGHKRDLTRIFCFGIGTDVNTRLLDRIAEETSALSQYVLPDEDIEVKVSSFFSKISDPVLADVKLDLGKIRATKTHPGKLPDLFKGQQLIVLGRYKEDGSTTAKITGKVADREQTFTYALEFPERESDHSFIPKLWANRRVGYLLDQVRLHGENAELREEITELARQYAIVTPYTSFLVQEDQPVLAAGSSSYDPLASHRRNPELMKRYFPHVMKKQTPAGAPPAPTSGDLAVADSRYSSALKSAVTEQQVRLAENEIRAFGATGKLLARSRSESGPSVRSAGGRSFQLDQGAWIETGVATLKDTKVEQIVFDSPEYWKLANAHPELREVLALGTNVQFILNGKVYRIVSRPAEPASTTADKVVR